MKKILQALFSLIFIGFITIIGFMTLFNNESLSYTEGRKLTTFPKFSAKKMLDKDYLDELTLAFSDQMEFRSSFIKTYYLFNMQKYMGNVAKGENNQLYAAPLVIKDKKVYKKNLNKSIERINKVAKKVTKNSNRKFIYLSIPRKDQVMTEYLPDNYIKSVTEYKKGMKYIKENLSDNIIVIDAMELFNEHKGEADFYYSTDHHVNMRGAQIVYEKLLEIVKKDYPNIKFTDIDRDYIISKTIINGSYNRQLGGSVNAGEEELYLEYKDKSLKYTRYEDGKVSDMPIFSDGNDYKVYMGGDMAETLVKTNNKNAPNILFSGSSYTNILEAFSIASFKDVASVDYKNNKTGKGLDEYAREVKADYVVFVPASSYNPFSATKIREHLGLKKGE